MKVKIVGFLWERSEEVSCNLECEVLCQQTPPTLQEVLIRDGFAILRTISDKPRFFLFTGSRLSETKTLEETQGLAALLLEGEQLASRTSLRTPYDPFHEYRKTVEVGGGLTIYSEKDGVATIQSSAQ